MVSTYWILATLGIGFVCFAAGVALTSSTPRKDKQKEPVLDDDDDPEFWQESQRSESEDEVDYEDGEERDDDQEDPCNPHTYEEDDLDVGDDANYALDIGPSNDELTELTPGEVCSCSCSVCVQLRSIEFLSRRKGDIEIVIVPYHDGKQRTMRLSVSVVNEIKRLSGSIAKADSTTNL